MPKYIYVQIKGVDRPAKVEADSVERQSRTTAQQQQGQLPQHKLILKKGDQEVGEFNALEVVGWWLQDE